MPPERRLKWRAHSQRLDKTVECLPVAKCNETMSYIIRGDPNRDAVSSNDPDMMTSHFPTEFGKDLHIIICQGDRVPIAFADIRDRSFDLDQIISCHRTSPCIASY